MLKQQLNIKLQQKMSPMQIQVIKMLEYPTVELEQKINDELMDNPALEIAADESKNSDETDDYVDDSDSYLTPDTDWAWNDDNDDTDDTPDYRLRANNRSVNDLSYSIDQTAGPDLAEHLNEQLSMLDIPERQAQLCRYIIGNLDNDGYLRRETDRMVDDLAMTAGVVVDDREMDDALKTIQALDPAGVGARNLRECLLIQLKQDDETPSPDHNLAVKIVERYFDLLAKKQFTAIKQRTSAPDETIEEALDIIQHLNPNPAANYDNGIASTAQTITPDFIAENIDGKTVISLNNSNVPDLRINPEYQLMLNEFNSNTKNQTRERRDAVLFTKQKIDAARWFIESINQRNSTLLTTMNVIAKYQQQYFLTGDDKQLRPLRLKDIADATGFDISTVSRVSNSKYVETEWGVIPLKHFFSEGLTNHEGEEISSKEIKHFIRETIDAEDKKSPIPDDTLTELLNKKGYKIARRTVAKYREQLNIPVARLRRTF